MKATRNVLFLAVCIALCVTSVTYAVEGDSADNGQVKQKILKETNDYIIVQPERETKPFFSSSNKSGEGWWYYQKDPEPKKIMKKKPKVTASAPAPAPKAQPKPKPVEEEAPAVGSTKWLQQNIESYKQLAIDNPTVENLKAFLYIQKLAIDRAEQFAQAGRMAMQGDPLLDASSKTPLGGSANVTRDAYISQEQKRLLHKIFKKVGVFYLFKDRCYLCDLQSDVLKELSNAYGITVKAVSLDQPSDGSISAKNFPDYDIAPELRHELKVLALPATFLYNAETDEIKPLLQGMVTASTFNSRTIDAAMKYNWIDKTDYRYVKPFDDAISISEMFSMGSDFSKRVQSKGGKDPYGKNTNFIAPSELVDMIQDQKYKEIPKDYVPRGY